MATVLGLAHAITNPSPSRRDEGAAQVTDVVRDLTADEVTVLAHLLVEARLVETDGRCREQQLNSLCTLREWHALPPEALARLRYLATESIDRQQAEYLQELLGSG